MADGASWGYDERQVLADIIAALDATLRGRSQPAVLLVKRHPRETAELTLPKAASLAIRVVDDSFGDYRELVAASDFVLGMNSNLLLEACLLGKPVVSYQPGLLRPDPLPSNRLGWSRAVTTRDALAPALVEEIFDDSRRRSREELLRSLPRPSGAAERVMRLLLADFHGCDS
jgi:CDP-glycerol glycerophosphotransferase (TagB/SpsB family)